MENNIAPANPYSDNRFIGFVTMVSPLLSRVHFPSSVLLKKFYQAEEGFHALTGKYVIIEGSGYGFLGKIIEVSLPEKERLELTESRFDKEAFHPTGKVEILLCFDNYELKAKKGLNQLPPVSAKVFLCSNSFLRSLLKDFGKKDEEFSTSITLATLPGEESCKVNIAAQALFGRHCAVVGTTGGGKSWTVAKLIEEIIASKGKAILIDPTGEYETLKQKQLDYFRFNSQEEDGIHFNYRKLKETDLFALFRPSQQSQLPKLQEAFKSLRLVNKLLLLDDTQNKHLEHNNQLGYYSLKKQGFENDKEILALFKTHREVNFSNCDLDIQALSNQIIKECVGDNRAKENCSTLISRILLTINDESFFRVFDFKNENYLSKSKDFEQVVSHFFQSDKNILVLSVADVSTENKLKEILVNSIGRFLLEKALNKEFKQKDKKSLLLFLDEAHLFLNKQIKDEYSIEVELNAFERIAKECRKFGLFLVLATQMPRDIPKGVLSQMGTFIVHRLINQQDREAIEYACSEANKSALSFLPILSAGEAMITGVDFPMPIILKIIKPTIEPDSITPPVL
jgi:DNA helicase HerA-like ATPase